MLEVVLALLISAAPPACLQEVTPDMGIYPKRASVRTGSSIRFRIYTKPGIPATPLSVGNPKIASVDTARGLVRGLSPGGTYVKVKVFNGKCLVRDSALLRVRPR